MDSYGAPIEIKGISENGEFEGYGSVFGVVDLGGDVVERGAFRESLSEHAKKGTWPALLYHHSMPDQIGEWLEIEEDSIGLKVRGKLWIDGDKPDDLAMRAHRGMKKKRGKMGLSIGYRTKVHEWDREEEIRKLKEVDLLEISTVVFPMNEAARVTNAKAAEHIKTIREFETFLREGGFSVEAAKAIASGGFKQIDPRDESDPSKPLDPRDEADGVNELLKALESVKAALKSKS